MSTESPRAKDWQRLLQMSDGYGDKNMFINDGIHGHIKVYKIFFSPWYPCVSSKKFCQFGPAVWPAIAYVIYINEQKLYYIEEDILVPYRYFCSFSNQGIFRNLIIM